MDKPLRDGINEVVVNYLRARLQAAKQSTLQRWPTKWRKALWT